MSSVKIPKSKVKAQIPKGRIEKINELASSKMINIQNLHHGVKTKGEDEI
jgi:hypothetical protein